jgi:hypothetical protein
MRASPGREPVARLQAALRRAGEGADEPAVRLDGLDSISSYPVDEIPSWVAWPLAMFAATTVYLLGASLQLAVVSIRSGH